MIIFRNLLTSSRKLLKRILSKESFSLEKQFHFQPYLATLIFLILKILNLVVDKHSFPGNPVTLDSTGQVKVLVKVLLKVTFYYISLCCMKRGTK